MTCVKIFFGLRTEIMTLFLRLAMLLREKSGVGFHHPLLRLCRSQHRLTVLPARVTVLFLSSLMSFPKDARTITHRAAHDRGLLLRHKWENLGILHYQVIAFGIQFLLWTFIFTKERKVVWGIRRSFIQSFLCLHPPAFSPSGRG